MKKNIRIILALLVVAILCTATWLYFNQDRVTSQQLETQSTIADTSAPAEPEPGLVMIDDGLLALARAAAEATPVYQLDGQNLRLVDFYSTPGAPNCPDCISVDFAFDRAVEPGIDYVITVETLGPSNISVAQIRQE